MSDATLMATQPKRFVFGGFAPTGGADCNWGDWGWSCGVLAT
jgi:hypothetical protein